MFTGLVEVLGTVSKLSPLDTSAAGGGGTSLIIENAADILNDANLGDSISVNGTCLTVTSLPSPSSFTVGIAPETLRRTNLGSLKEGSKVNLERALLPHTRLGGHFLQGHVDTIATIVDKRPDGNAVVFRFKPRESNVLRYIVEKGYVALDGASLTITAVSDEERDGWFEVMLIAYTQERVVTSSKNVGEEVNVEVDMVGKYVEKSITGYLEGKHGSGSPVIIERMVERILDQKLNKQT